MYYNFVTNRTCIGAHPVTVKADEVEYVEKRSFGFGGDYRIRLKDGRTVFVDKRDAEMVARSAGVEIE